MGRGCNMQLHSARRGRTEEKAHPVGRKMERRGRRGHACQSGSWPVTVTDDQKTDLLKSPWVRMRIFSRFLFLPKQRQICPVQPLRYECVTTVNHHLTGHQGSGSPPFAVWKADIPLSNIPELRVYLGKLLVPTFSFNPLLLSHQFCKFITSSCPGTESNQDAFKQDATHFQPRTHQNGWMWVPFRILLPAITGGLFCLGYLNHNSRDASMVCTLGGNVFEWKLDTLNWLKVKMQRKAHPADGEGPSHWPVPLLCLSGGRLLEPRKLKAQGRGVLSGPVFSK